MTSRRAFIASAAATALARPALSQAPQPPIVLEAAKTSLRIRPEPAPLTELLAYNGASPGPVLRVKKGQPLALQLVNKLEEPTSIHWIGLRTEASLEGVGGLSGRAVAAGEAADVRLVPRDAGTYIYEPYVPGRTAAQADRGLYGLMIVEEPAPPVADKEILVLIDDWRLDENAAIPPDVKPEPGALPRLGNVLTINGQPKALQETLPTGGRARLRVANAATGRILTLRFEGVPATIVALDGQPSSTAFQPKGAAAILTPGGRIDLMVDLPGETGQSFTLNVQLSPEVSVPVAILRSAGDRRAALPPVAALPPNDLPKILDLARAQRVELTIEGGPQPQAKPLPWTLNKRANPTLTGPPLFTTRRGTTMVLSFINQTAIAQAMRIHGHHGRLLFVMDDGWDPFWIDTALIQPGRTARLAFVADNPGRWPLRSAMADLFDAGLCGWFEVA